MIRRRMQIRLARKCKNPASPRSKKGESHGA